MSDESSDESKNEKRRAALELDASAAATGSTSGRKKKARRRQPEESKHNSFSASSVASSANPATQSGVDSSVGAVPDTMLPLFQQLHAPQPPASQAPSLTQQQLLLDQMVLRRLQEGFQQSHLQGLSMSGPSASLQQPQQQQHWQNGISSQELQQIAQSLQQHRQPQVLNPAFAAPHSYPTPPPSRDTDTRTTLNRNAILEHLLRQSNGGAAALPSTGMSNPSPLLRQQQQQQQQQLYEVAAQQLLLNNPSLLHSSGLLGGSSRRLELESLLLQQQQQQQPRQEQAQPQQLLSDHRNAVALQSLLDPRLRPELLAAQQQLQQSRHPQPHGQSTASLRASTGIPLALPNDAEHLSSYQVLLRKQLEFFVSEQADCETSVQGRKKGVQLGQVGLRCRHCAHINPVRLRGRGSIYYPQKLGGVYQAAQNMATTHLAVACAHIPESVRQELASLHNRRDTAAGGKRFWADACRRMGMTEGVYGIRFDPAASTSSRGNNETAQRPA